MRDDWNNSYVIGTIATTKTLLEIPFQIQLRVEVQHVRHGLNGDGWVLTVRVHLVDLLQHLFWQLGRGLLECIHVLLQLLHRCSPNDGRRHEPTAHTEFKCKRRHRHSCVFGDYSIPLARLGCVWRQEANHPILVHGVSALLRKAAFIFQPAILIEVLVGQHASSERSPGQEADVVVRGCTGLGKLSFKRAVQKRKLILNRDRSRAADLVRCLHPLTNAKGGFIGQAIVSNLS
mmetsp:Transcript_11833/g.40777  ORF Transcript_11833/g.40777 Transcript_11833/m.40777 type:complete len:233 (-) Transcript_11833:637-1335(-)